MVRALTSISGVIKAGETKFPITTYGVGAKLIAWSSPIRALKKESLKEVSLSREPLENLSDSELSNKIIMTGTEWSLTGQGESELENVSTLIKGE